MTNEVLQKLNETAAQAVSKERQAKEAHDAATEARKEAFRAYNSALLADREIVIGETIVEAARWYSATKGVRAVVVGSAERRLGFAAVREVTRGGRVWMGRKPFSVEIENMKPTGECLTVDEP